MITPVMRSPTEYVFAVAFAAWLVPEMFDSIRRRNSRGPNLDAKSVYGIYVAIFLSCFGGWFFRGSAPSWAEFGSFTIPLFWVGIVLMCAGICLRWYSVMYLGDAFTRTVTVSDDQSIVDTGPYSVVRHPTYTGILITMVGFEFCLGTWIAVLTGLFVGLAAFGYRIRVEELALRAELNGYADYCERTPYRLVPHVF